MTRLLGAVERAADHSAAEVVVFENGRPCRTRWTELHQEARALAGRLQARGAGPGATVALLAETSLAALTALRAVLLSGAAVTVVAPPATAADPACTVRAVRAALVAAGADLLLVGPPFTELARLPAGELPCPVVDLSDLPAPAPWRQPEIDEDSTAVLQLTSGTTGTPRQVRVSHRNLAANIDAIQSRTGTHVGTGARCSWLPLHHDLGLIGYAILPMVTSTRLVLRPPSDFLADPLSWLRTVSDYAAVSTSAPAFGYAVLARLLRAASGLDLSTLRLALCGAEQIEPAVVEAFCAAAAPFGFDAAAMVAAYGLAEATVAVTMSAPGTGLRTESVDRDALHAGHARVVDGPASRRLTVLGTALPGLELRVLDRDTGQTAEPRQVGEVLVRGPSVATVTGNPNQVVVDADGWLHTGDRGYLTRDTLSELVVCGRIKDVLVVAGRTIQPEEVELACATVPGIRPGGVAAVPYPRPHSGTEGVAVVAELRRGHDPADGDTARRITECVRQAVGVAPDLVKLVAAGTIPRTSSGKLQRHRVATRLDPAGRP